MDKLKANFMTSMQVRERPNGARSKSRTALVHLLNFNLRSMEAWRLTQMKLTGAALDAESTLMLMAIVAIGADKLVATDRLREFEDLERPMDISLLKKCTLGSIAATTGINRETVRRRILKLEQIGLVERQHAGGVTIAGGVLQRTEVQECVGKQVRDLAYTVNQLNKTGILELRVEGQLQKTLSRAEIPADGR